MTKIADLNAVDAPDGIVNVLRCAADRIGTRGPYELIDDAVPLYDINGNNVGSMRIETK